MILFICMISMAYAHVQIVYPNGGETFSGGASITIQWQEAIGHGEADWDIYFTADGGVNWQQVVMDLNHSSTSYDWQLPQEMTDKAQILVKQDNAAGPDYDSISGVFTITGSSGIEKDVHSNKKSFVLYPAYPNPFNGSTTISFYLEKNSNVEINIFNILGRHIQTLINHLLTTGEHSIYWNPQNLSSGMYYFTIKNGLNSESRRLVYLK